MTTVNSAVNHVYDSWDESTLFFGLVKIVQAVMSSAMYGAIMTSLHYAIGFKSIHNTHKIK